MSHQKHPSLTSREVRRDVLDSSRKFVKVLGWNKRRCIGFSTGGRFGHMAFSNFGCGPQYEMNYNQNSGTMLIFSSVIIYITSKKAKVCCI